MRKLKLNKISPYLFLAFCAIILLLSVRGLPGTPNASMLRQPQWRDDGPFELSPERGRFALIYSLIETHSVYFPTEIARFVIPDLGYSGGHYVSLFAPALSFITAPGYIIGKIFGISQVGTFLVVSLFGLINVFLIIKIALLLGANRIAAMLGGLTYIFATPSFAYSVNLYQHQPTTFLVLLSIYLVIINKRFLTSFGILFLFALGISLDYPNFFILFPFLFVLLFRMINISAISDIVTIKINWKSIIGVVGIILPTLFFFWFNNASYGGPLRLLGGPTVTSIKAIDEAGNPAKLSKQQVYSQPIANKVQESTNGLSYFSTRNLLSGLYIHFLSPDRGIVFYTPVILFGVIGMVVLYRRKNKYLALMLSVIFVNIVLYSLWDDPWGGWAFGSRYLIPAYSIMSIFIATFLTEFRKNILLLVLFLVFLLYSVSVNTLGAVTSSANPPEGEAKALEVLSGKIERYSFDRNWEFLSSQKSKSYIYQSVFRNSISAVSYFILLSSLISSASVFMLIMLWRNNK